MKWKQIATVESLALLLQRRLRFAAALLADLLTVSLCLLLAAVLWAGIKEQTTGEWQYICGYKAIRIISGSMEPIIQTGAVVFIEQVETDEVKKGDIVAFSRGGTYVTHRIVGEDEEAKKRGAAAFLITKGDHNQVEDNARLAPASICGKVAAIWNLFAALPYGKAAG